MSENKKRLISITLITLLAGILRFWQLDKLPVSPNWDEVSHGYNAYSVLKTGKDEWGQQTPLIFRAFGDYKLPLYVYLTIFPVSIFGLNIFAVRFISALAGMLAIPGIYLLARELFSTVIASFISNRRVASGDPKQSHISNPTKSGIYKFIPLASAFLLAISPWHFFISRPALEANLSLTLIIFGFYFLLKFFKTGGIHLLPAALLLGLSLHTYNTARVFVPLLLIFSLLIFRKSLSWRFKVSNILAALFFSASLLLVGLQVLSGEGSARYEKLRILSPSVVFQIGEARSNSDLPPLLAKVVHNRPVFFVSTVVKNYLGYFSPSFFNQTWGAQFQFAIPGQNLLTIPVYLFSIFGGLIMVTRLKKSRKYLFVLSWLLLSPIAGSLTIDPPQALRPNPMIIPLVILASFGLSFLLGNIPQKLSKVFLVVFLSWVIVSFSSYLYQYNTEYKLRYSSSWQYGYEQVMKYVKENSSKYEKIFITKKYGEPHIFYSFFVNLDPRLLQPSEHNLRFQKSDWFWTDRIGNIYFINDWQIPTTSISELPLESGATVATQRSLLITSPDRLPINANVIERINFLDGSPAFIITSIP